LVEFAEFDSLAEPFWEPPCFSALFRISTAANSALGIAIAISVARGVFFMLGDMLPGNERSEQHADAVR
jgi:hypothetical protein